MTVNNATSSVTHTGNGVATTWPFNFLVQQAEDLEVGLFNISSGTYTVLAEILYSVTGLDQQTGGDVEYPLSGPPLSSNFRIVISRKLPFTQDTDLTNQTPYYPEVLEKQLDRIVMMLQQMRDDVSRAVLVTEGSNVNPADFIQELFEAVDDALGYASAASLSAAAAAESAEAAATFDPGSYWTKSEAYAKTETYSQTEINSKIDPIKEGFAVSITTSLTEPPVLGSVIYAKTAGGAITIPLPAVAENGNFVEVWRFGANDVTIGRNTNTIAGLAEDLTVDSDKTIVRLTWMDAGWHVEKRTFA